MKAYFAGGCFWCMEKPYHTLEGVTSVVSGYCGGDETSPTYAEVKAQRTMHRETVCIEYDENKVSFSDLLEMYFLSIDPFDGGGQFIDRGRSYTCAVYYTDKSQRALAAEKIASLEASSGMAVAVSLEPYKKFYPAEEYHQNYAEKNPEAYAEEYASSGRKDYFEGTLTEG